MANGNELSAWQISVEKRLAVVERNFGIKHHPESPAPTAMPVRTELVAMRDRLRREYDEAEAHVLGVYEAGQVDPRAAYRAAVRAWRILKAFQVEALEATRDVERFGAAMLPPSPETLPMLTSIRLRVGEDLSPVDRSTWASVLPEAIVR